APNRNISLACEGWEFCMTKTALLRKMNPRGGQVCLGESMLVKGNAWLGGASEGMNVRLLGVTEGRENEETQVGGRSSFGHGVGRVAGIGTGCGKEGTAETSAESFAGGPGTVERNRAKIDHHRGGFAGRYARLQTECGCEDICRGRG